MFGNPEIKTKVGCTYLDNQGTVVRIRKQNFKTINENGQDKKVPTGWFVSALSSYNEKGESFHGPKYNLWKQL
jgi:hypothetical protein